MPNELLRLNRVRQKYKSPRWTIEPNIDRQSLLKFHIGLSIDRLPSHGARHAGHKNRLDHRQHSVVHFANARSFHELDNPATLARKWMGRFGSIPSMVLRAQEMQASSNFQLHANGGA